MNRRTVDNTVVTGEGRGSVGGALFVMAAIFLWSSLGVVVRLSGVSVPQLVFFSTLVSLLLLSFIIVRPRYRSLMPRGRSLLPVLGLGPVLLLNTMCFFYAFRHTTIANALMTHYIAPVVVSVLAPFMLKERFSGTAALAIGISSIGLWIMLEGDAGPYTSMGPGQFGNHLGILAGLASGMAYAFLIILVRTVAQGHDPLVLAYFQNLTVCLILAPFIREFPEKGIGSIILMGIVHATLAPLLYFKGLALVSASRAAILGYMEPVCAILFAAAVLAEYPSAWSLAGGCLILFAGYLTLRGGVTAEGRC